MPAPAPDEVYRGATRFFSVVIIGFAVAILVVTFAGGGGVTSFGFLIGLVFLALGCGRFYLSLRDGG